MHKWIRTNSLRALKTAGAFDRLRDSQWRKSRLLILCYHGVALEEENQWRPALFISSARLQERFEMLKKGEYRILPLGEAVTRLYRNDLPPRSVVLTFDDGTYDFYKLAYPLLKHYGFPATVYQATYYVDHPFPVFHLICSYMLWKRRDAILSPNVELGLLQEVNLSAPQTREFALNRIVNLAEQRQLSTLEKNQLAIKLAEALRVDYKDLVAKRVLQLMTPQEIAELAAAGIDFQLHTHRHRTPRDRNLFEREIHNNREKLDSIVKTPLVHFCYPSGDYDLMFLPWLKENAVISATTCEPGLASHRDHPLLLPRFIDTTGKTALEFESWLTGVSAVLSTLRPRPRKA